MMTEWIFDPQIWASLLTLTVLEIVLGIDNIIFLSIVSSRLPEAEAARARRLGLLAALLMRVALLAGIAWIVGLSAPIARIFGFALSWRDVLMLGGGLFLLTKGTYEIHHSVEGEEEAHGGAAVNFAGAIAQIMLLDVVFSLDSVITAVGMAEHLPVMVAAVTVAMAIMLLASGPVSAFIERHPTVKMLALSFLLLVGVALVADGLHFHIPRGYLYFAIAFSIGVESLNQIAARRRRARAARS
jgi:predicted tellurium resistance membrane protein TerC